GDRREPRVVGGDLADLPVRAGEEVPVPARLPVDEGTLPARPRYRPGLDPDAPLADGGVGRGQVADGVGPVRDDRATGEQLDQLGVEVAQIDPHLDGVDGLRVPDEQAALVAAAVLLLEPDTLRLLRRVAEQDR